ncbi:MAG: 2-dehydropantoate 2-reductase [Alphaproteobacteria bacterium]|nr:2-dehydropantoate 2-reductase [Alphaproteobacteria bacterium]
MRIGIFGAGAIGGLLAARLMQAGAEVTVVARGPHLAAMQAHGLRLISGGETITTHPRCAADAEAAGEQDFVVVTLKAHALPGAAPAIARMLGREGTLVTGVNGIPYWYFYGAAGPLRDRTLESVDPGGVLWRTLPPAQALGCVVYPAAEVIEPGVVAHTYSDRFTLGEPDGSRSARAETFAQALQSAGFKAPIRPRIRDEIWVKLWGNMAFNPLSALTGATLDRITGRPDLRAAARTMMVEGQQVAEALGVRFPIGVDKRIEGAAEVGAHRTSMLQDLERGRPMEIDALLGAVVELAHLTNVAVPACELVLALLRERGRQSGCYAG